MITKKTYQATKIDGDKVTVVKWVIDGATHSAEGGPQLSYRGSC